MINLFIKLKITLLNSGSNQSLLLLAIKKVYYLNPNSYYNCDIIKFQRNVDFHKKTFDACHKKIRWYAVNIKLM